MPYANTAGSDARSNYLGMNVTFSPAYIDNVLPGSDSTPVSDVTYSILPSLSLDHSAPRQREQFTYSPSFTFYEPTSTLDSVDQNATAGFQYRFNPRVALNVQDNFTRTSNVYNSTYLFSNPISGSSLTPTPTVIAPFAEQMVNTVNGVLSYQFGLNAMIGGGGAFTNFDLPNPTDAAGLYSSNQIGAQIFYNRRLSRAQYLGLQYQYAHILAYPLTGVSETQIHSLLPFYTFYFNQAFSFSISAGIQRIDSSETGLPNFSSWSPSGTVSVGWQGSRGNVAASFSHTCHFWRRPLGGLQFKQHLCVRWLETRSHLERRIVSRLREHQFSDASILYHPSKVGTRLQQKARSSIPLANTSVQISNINICTKPTMAST